MRRRRPTGLPPAFLTHVRGVRVDSVELTEDGVAVTVSAVRPRAPCPRCGQGSHRLHSRYTRTVADLPWSGARVTVQLHTRRFRCGLAACPRRVFCERLPLLVRPHARRSERLQRLVTAVAYAMGGRPGARLLRQAPTLAGPLSRHTLLRLVRAAAEPVVAPPRVVGIDDWALKRGRTYGTLVVDLERRRPIDLLPDRTADTVAAWLRAHGGDGQIEVIARDRGGAYAEGARQGAPAALQVADRWHLMKNLGDAVERLLTRHHRALPAAAQALATATATPLASAPPGAVTPSPPGPHVRRHVQEQQAQRARRLTRYEAVRARRAQGESIRVIARQVGLARGTVHRYLRAETFPEQQPRPRERTQVTPFEPYLRERWQAGCRNATALWRDLRARGFTGGKTSVRDLVARWRTAAGEPAPTSPRPAAPARPRPSIRYSTRQATWLLLRRPEELAADEHAYLQALFRHCPDLGVAHGLVLDFLAIVRQRQEHALASWVAVATDSDLPELTNFATGLLRDWAAVRAALTSEWSNGQTEGQVNRLKLAKRQMFGRAKFDLLRRRVLYRGDLEP